MSEDTRQFGIFRGIVKDNTGDKGYCKIFIPGVYPTEYENNTQLLPWAEPAQSLFGGNYSSSAGLNSETGICSWPKIDAVVFVFFDQGDHNFPVYFAASQGGTGWISEHNKQYTIQTDNVKIRIDDNPSNPKSTCKNQSYSDKSANASIPLGKKLDTTLEIEVKGNVNLKITGDVNLQINGKVYEEINGDVIKTHIGNYYEKHVGDSIIVQQGSKSEKIDGDYSFSIKGDLLHTINGKVYSAITGDVNEIISGSKTSMIMQRVDLSVLGGKSERITGTADFTVIGAFSTYIQGAYTHTVNGISFISLKTPVYLTPVIPIPFGGSF